MTAKIGVIYEPEAELIGRAITRQLIQFDCIIDLKLLSQFPIGNSMNCFFKKLEHSYQIAIIALSNKTRSYSWISKELKIQHNMRNFCNIYPAFSDFQNVPSCWSVDLDRLLFASQPPPNWLKNLCSDFVE